MTLFSDGIKLRQNGFVHSNCVSCAVMLKKEKILEFLQLLYSRKVMMSNTPLTFIYYYYSIYSICNI